MSGRPPDPQAVQAYNSVKSEVKYKYIYIYICIQVHMTASTMQSHQERTWNNRLFIDQLDKRRGLLLCQLQIGSIQVSRGRALPSSLQECPLHNSVLQTVKGDDCQPAVWSEAVNGSWNGLFQHCQLLVHCYPQCLYQTHSFRACCSYSCSLDQTLLLDLDCDNTYSCCLCQAAASMLVLTMLCICSMDKAMTVLKAKLAHVLIACHTAFAVLVSCALF